ncbi:MAG: hypothetical protein ACK45I_09150 [Bacteroidota bacterium]|jgi:hypothetical protein
MEPEINHYLITVQRDAQHTYDARESAPTAFEAVLQYRNRNPAAKIIAVRLANRK